MKKIRFVSLIACVSVVLSLSVAPASAVRGTAPDFHVLDLAGREIWLSKLKGCGVVLQFAASWCGGIKGGTGVALMVTLGFGRAGVEMLRSAQHDRLVPMNDAYERSRISLNPRFIE